MCTKSTKLKNGTGGMATYKIEAFYLVITWKLLFRDGLGGN